VPSIRNTLFITNYLTYNSLVSYYHNMNFLTDEEVQTIKLLELPINRITSQLENYAWVTAADILAQFQHEDGIEYSTAEQEELIEGIKYLSLPLQQACNKIIGEGITHASLAKKPTLQTVTERIVKNISQSADTRVETLGVDECRKQLSICTRTALSELFLETRSPVELNELFERTQYASEKSEEDSASFDAYIQMRKTHGGEIDSNMHKALEISEDRPDAVLKLIRIVGDDIESLPELPSR
jgi:hypothetical protein